MATGADNSDSENGVFVKDNTSLKIDYFENDIGKLDGKILCTYRIA